MHQSAAEPGGARNYPDQNVLTVKRARRRNRFNFQTKTILDDFAACFQRGRNRRTRAPVADIQLGGFAIKEFIALLQPAPHHDALIPAFSFHTHETGAILWSDWFG